MAYTELGQEPMAGDNKGPKHDPVTSTLVNRN